MLSRHLRRNFDWFLVPLAAVVVLQSIYGVAQLAEAKLAPSAQSLAIDPALAGHIAHADPTTPFHATSAAAILARNPFDSETGPLDRDRGNAALPVAADSPDAPSCDGVKVVGIVTSSDPDWSLAAFEATDAPSKDESSSGHALLRRRGGVIGSLRVAQIRWDRVLMESPRGTCTAAMFAPPAVAASATPVLAHPTVAAAPLESWIQKGIETVSPTHRIIDRALVPRILEKQAELLGTVRPVPEQVNGKPVGYRVMGVKEGSLLAALGVANGDRLQTINGFDLTNPQSAIEAYAQLQRAEHLVLQVNRGGNDIQLELDIR